MASDMTTVVAAPLFLGAGPESRELLRAHAVAVADAVASAHAADRPYSGADPVALAAAIAAIDPCPDEGIAFADQMLGNLAMTEGDLDQAAALLVRARDRYRRSRVTVDAGYTLIDLTRVRLAQHDFDEALTVAGEAIADFRSREDPRGAANALWCLGQAYAGLGQPERARHALDEARALTKRWGFALWPSGQSDEPGQESAFGAGVQALADERSRAVGARVGEEGDRDVSLAEELR